MLHLLDGRVLHRDGPVHEVADGNHAQNFSAGDDRQVAEVEVVDRVTQVLLMAGAQSAAGLVVYPCSTAGND